MAMWVVFDGAGGGPGGEGGTAPPQRALGADVLRCAVAMPVTGRRICCFRSRSCNRRRKYLAHSMCTFAAAQLLGIWQRVRIEQVP
jgi:hypothetical protein